MSGKLKRICLCITAAALMLFAFSACTDRDIFSREGRLVLMVGEGAVPAFEQMARDFTAETGVPVRVVGFSGLSASDRLALDGPLGRGQDIYLQGVGGDLAQAVERGLFLRLDPDDFADKGILEQAKELYFIQGNMYGVPLGLETYAIVYNRAFFPNGIPATWTEFEQQALAINHGLLGAPASRRFGFLMDVTNPFFTNAFVEAHGGFIFERNEDGSWNPQSLGIDTQATRNAYEFLRSNLERQVIASRERAANALMNVETMGNLFRNRQVGALLDGPWSIPRHRQAGIDVGVARIPAVDVGGEYRTPIAYSGAFGLAISAYSLNPELSVQFLQFAMRTENVMRYNQLVGRLPAVEFDENVFELDPAVSGFLQQIPYSVPQPNISQFEAIWNPLITAANQIFLPSNWGNPVGPPLVTAQQTIESQINVFG